MHSHKSTQRYGDQLHCGHCGKQWDVNDLEPPSCISWPDKIRNNLNLRRHCCNSTCRQDEIANDMKRLCNELERLAMNAGEVNSMQLVVSIRNKYK